MSRPLVERCTVLLPTGHRTKSPQKVVVEWQLQGIRLSLSTTKVSRRHRGYSKTKLDKGFESNNGNEMIHNDKARESFFM